MSSKSATKKLPLLPLRDVVIYPHIMAPLPIGREKSINALEYALEKRVDIIMATQKDSKNKNPDPDDIYKVATLGSVIQLLRLPDGNLKALVEGKQRVKILDYTKTDGHFEVLYDLYPDTSENAKETIALNRTIKEKFEIYTRFNKKISDELLPKVNQLQDSSRLGDFVATHLNISVSEKQNLLEIQSVRERLEKVLHFLIEEIDILETEKKIRGRVKAQIEKSQKEYYLNEQIQAIQKELGGKDDHQLEIEEFEKKLSEKKMSKKAFEKISKEIKKLKLMSPISAEATVLRNYVTWILDLPWEDYDEENFDLKRVKKVLDKEHWGLQDIKERILESLSVRVLNPKSRAPIICFVGPPGVGKTSLAHSIARSLKRSFVRVSLGGVQDEAEIRGHRKTYVGAMPGKIIQGLKKAGSGNPLVLLDEVDKLSVDFRGDPASALLEVLDPEQNKTFEDHYLELEYDLSKVMFITTANSMYGISHPLLDRMEVIELDGYTDEEKVSIAKKHIVPKQLGNSGLENYKVVFSDKIIHEMITYYTREAGVRQMERTIQKVCQALAKKIVIEKGITSPKKLQKKRGKPLNITSDTLNEFLGHRKYRYKKAGIKGEIGVTNGLAWTECGGDLLPVEVSVIEGAGKFTLTGSLGDVMKESCTAALSYVRSRGSLLGFDKEFFKNIDIHIHVPEGAIPKDGPSAGIAITTSIVSALTKIPVKRSLALTGEVTLRGRVLEIGGLKQKILAAHRGNIKTIIIPKANEHDLGDISKKVIKNLKIILVDHVDQVLVNALDIKDTKELFKVKSKHSARIKAQYTGHSLH